MIAGQAGGRARARDKRAARHIPSGRPGRMIELPDWICPLASGQGGRAGGLAAEASFLRFGRPACWVERHDGRLLISRRAKRRDRRDRPRHLIPSARPIDWRPPDHSNGGARAHDGRRRGRQARAPGRPFRPPDRRARSWARLRKRAGRWLQLARSGPIVFVYSFAPCRRRPTICERRASCWPCASPLAAGSAAAALRTLQPGKR